MKNRRTAARNGAELVLWCSLLIMAAATGPATGRYGVGAAPTPPRRDVSLALVKTSSPTTVPETGALVTYNLTVENTSISPLPIDLGTLVDDLYGDVTTIHGQIQSTSCELPPIITSGGSYLCFFTVWVTGVPGEEIIDTVTVTGYHDDVGQVTASDSATVLVALQEMIFGDGFESGDSSAWL